VNRSIADDGTAYVASARILQALHKPYLSLEKLMLTSETVPDEIKYCHQLLELDLSGNKLTMIPPQLKHLTRLQRLYLEYNDLESLNGIEKLTNLRELHLARNRLSYLPPSMGHFTNLQTLRLDANPLDTIPKDIIPRKTMTSPGEMQQLLAYLRGIGGGGKEAHNQVKVMFVGDGNVGKTRYDTDALAHSLTD
jgi:internalin A